MYHFFFIFEFLLDLLKMLIFGAKIQIFLNLKINRRLFVGFSTTVKCTRLYSVLPLIGLGLLSNSKFLLNDFCRKNVPRMYISHLVNCTEFSTSNLTDIFKFGFVFVSRIKHFIFFTSFRVSLRLCDLILMRNQTAFRSEGEANI